jgi:hypothetical protein
MSRKLFLSLVVLIALSWASFARADAVTASGAGSLPSSAEDLTGINVSEIIGTIPDQLGVNMFKINITDFADFSAITIGPGPFGIPDTELLLFNVTGAGVFANDDISGSNTLSCLPSAGAGNPCSTPLPSGVGPTADGTYYLAITRSQDLPLDGGSNDIFTYSLSTDVVGPNSGAGTIASWDDGVFTSPDTDLINYDILLTGTSSVPTPEPATWILIATGMVFILLQVKKLASA